MTSTIERVGWAIAFLVLAALGIPWFLWGTDSVVAGLPVWLWWHVGWMVVTAGVFWLFTRRGWGVWIESDADDRPGATPPGPDAGAAEASASGAGASDTGGDGQ